MSAPLDRHARPLHDVRISVTDRCNLRCRYCMPREAFGRDFVFKPASELLSFEEITRVCRGLAAAGARKVRLTGGEPLLRRQIERLVEMVAAVEGIEQIAMTTNGTLLASKAKALKDAGLTRVTVSLDALDEQVFRRMSDTRTPVARVLAGIDAASAAGLSPVKVNMVVRRGVNDGCVTKMAEFFRGRPEVLRFIEYMDVGSTNGWRLDEVVPAQEMIDSISRLWPLEPIASSRPGEVATRYRYLDGAGEVGFIHSISKPFCHACDRIRLSAEGRLYTCLFASEGYDVRALLRSGASDERLEDEIAGLWRRRGDRYSAERAALAVDGSEGPSGRKPRIEMSYIGG